MNLETLTGLHLFSGIDFDTKSIDGYGYLKSASVVNFVLDNKTYTVTEDPSDGYRSSMEDIIESEYKVINTFAEIAVFGIMHYPKEGYRLYTEDYVLTFYDVISNKPVLSVGTANSNDYYPSFVCEYQPNNMWINQDKN